MRIISGKHKGRRITAPKKLPVRPTTDRAKEALFNILANQFIFSEMNVLDLFSGTGNIVYEFSSRGASQVTAVDENYRCVQFIEKTITNLSMQVAVIKSEAYIYLEKTPHKFNLIFADPPYGFSEEDFLKIPKLVFRRNLLHEEGLLIIEHSKHTKLEHSPYFVEKRVYGGSAFSFFKEENNE